MGVFEGGDGKKILSARLHNLRTGMYKLAGQFVMWSLHQGGNGIPTLHPLHYSLILGVGLPPTLNLEEAVNDITDYEAQDVIREVKLASINII